MTRDADNRTTELRELLDRFASNLCEVSCVVKCDTFSEREKLIDDMKDRYAQAIAATLENGTQMQPRCMDCGTLLSDELRCTLCAEKLNAKLVSDRDEIYNAGFDNGVKATLHQLDGLLIKTDSAVEIQAWVDEQWKEYES
jgi:hypothetical protein